MIENREWGFDPATDGTLGKVVGFAEVLLTGMDGRMGVYRNRYWPIIEVDGKSLGAIYVGHLVAVSESVNSKFYCWEDDYLREVS